MTPGITIVGLGPGDPQLLSREAWQCLSTCGEAWLRTGRHPVLVGLPTQLRVCTFDELYDRLEDFEAVYQAIVDRVLELGSGPEGVVYGVPGDPTVGEATVAAITRKATVPVRLVHGVSFMEPCLAMLDRDALDGLVLADALELAARHHPPFPPDTPALIGQLYSSLVASDVKLTLLNQYPPDHPVALLHAVGSPQADLERRPLHEIDHSRKIEALTTLFVPAVAAASAFESFQETVAHLRAPDGCPWDREQTPQSLRPHLMEEAFEALQAIDDEDSTSLREELGDLLLQIILQAQIATEAGEFTMADVVAGIQAKILRRHPHVFGDLRLRDVDQVLHNWEVLKGAEREENGEDKGVLGGVPLGLPALAQAAEIQGRVARVGFDWPEAEGVLAKVAEELEEVKQAADPVSRSAEMGDLLFSVVNYARWLGVDPEASLRQANARFRRRFSQVEAAAQSSGRSLQKMSPEEMDTLWEVAKGGEEADASRGGPAVA
jgi:tetrapyrrole methylase family protein/MazG family protein